MPLAVTKFFDSLPLLWKLATVRLLVYLYIVGNNAWMASVEGFNSLADMTPMEIDKMHHRIIDAVAVTIVAFLDNASNAVAKNEQLTAADIKSIFADMQPGETVKQTAKVETASAPASTEITKIT